MKTWIVDPEGLRIKSRGLWDKEDLTKLSNEGWKLDSVQVEDAVTLDGGKTFLGVARQHLDEVSCEILYAALQRVQSESRAWQVRGPRILEKIDAIQPTFLALQEYDVQELPTGPHSSFRDALAARGYEGALFLGPGQEKVGVGLFWQRERASMVDTFPKDQVVPCGMETGSYGNVDLKEAGLRDMDRRLAGFVKLTVDELPTLLCGTHLMTGSRDKEGKIRQQELVTIADLMKAWADPGAGVILCGDFNVNSRGFLEEHIWEGTGYVRDSDTKANRFCWQRSGASPLILRDAFDSCYGDEACSSTRTGTRLETIDYIFFDEEAYTLLDSSKLRCPEQPMPNAEEPSDHIPVCATFQRIGK